MSAPAKPEFVVWDITYACPLRCTHCYSESGRRASRQLGRDDLLRVADALIVMQPKTIAFAGGEPLLVKELFEVAARFAGAGINVALYTSGWLLDPDVVDPVVSTFWRISVSIDGASARVHDRIRGRPGSFERALAALALLDRAVGERKRRGAAVPGLGIDCVVTRSNFHELEALCRDVAPCFSSLTFIAIGAVVPSGLASRPAFVEHELVTEEQLDQLGSAELAARLRAVAPPSVKVLTTDNRWLQMHPDLVARGVGVDAMQVEADGLVRAMASYEGTVGSLLSEPGEVLWQRAVARWRDPFVVETITPARTIAEWAKGTRLIDAHFGSVEVHARLQRRPDYTPV